MKLTPPLPPPALIIHVIVGIVVLRSPYDINAGNMDRKRDLPLQTKATASHNGVAWGYNFEFVQEISGRKWIYLRYFLKIISHDLDNGYMKLVDLEFDAGNEWMDGCT